MDEALHSGTQVPFLLTKSQETSTWLTEKQLPGDNGGFPETPQTRLTGVSQAFWAGISIVMSFIVSVRF